MPVESDPPQPAQQPHEDAEKIRQAQHDRQDPLGGQDGDWVERSDDETDLPEPVTPADVTTSSEPPKQGRPPDQQQSQGDGRQRQSQGMQSQQ